MQMQTYSVRYYQCNNIPRLRSGAKCHFFHNTHRKQTYGIYTLLLAAISQYLFWITFVSAILERYLLRTLSNDTHCRPNKYSINIMLGISMQMNPIGAPNRRILICLHTWTLSACCQAASICWSRENWTKFTKSI